MADKKNELFELYKTTRDELHHHDAMYIQVCVGLAIVFPIFLGAISFLFGEVDLGLYVNHTKWAILALAALLLIIFWWQIARVDARIAACRKATEEIEKLLNATSEFNGLLVGEKVDKNKLDTHFLAEKKRWFYIVLTIIVLAGLWLFLFKVI